MSSALAPIRTGTKNILCVSWVQSLAETRKLLLISEGYSVESVIGAAEALAHCRNSRADMLVLGQSVPREEKLKIVEVFRHYSDAPILSLINPSQRKLDQVQYGVDSLSPEEFLRTVNSVLSEKE